MKIEFLTFSPNQDSVGFHNCNFPASNLWRRPADLFIERFRFFDIFRCIEWDIDITDMEIGH